MWGRLALCLAAVLAASRLEEGHAASEGAADGESCSIERVATAELFDAGVSINTPASAPRAPSDRKVSVGTSLLAAMPAAAFRGRSMLEIIGSAFVFVAGLEGTGHHMMGAIFDKLAEANGGCTKNMELSHVVAQNIFPNGRGDSAELQRLLSDEAERAEQRKQLVALNTVSGLRLPGMMSYPDFSARSTSPNVTALENAVGAAGSRLRVLVTIRGTEGTIWSGCVHHKWSGRTSTCRDQALRLKEHGHALAEQLHSLPQGTALCLRYEDFLEHGRDVSKFLGKDLDAIMHETYKPRQHSAHYDTQVHEAAQLLESTIQELEHFCSSAQQISAVELLRAIARQKLDWLSGA